jgi:hypothetical protein
MSDNNNNKNNEPSHDESINNLPEGGTDVTLGESKGIYTIPFPPPIQITHHQSHTQKKKKKKKERKKKKNQKQLQFTQLPGLLSAVGDPLGNALNKGLSPVGTAVGGISNGGYGKSKEMDKKAAEQEEATKKFGGQEQTGQNPLGL